MGTQACFILMINTERLFCQLQTQKKAAIAMIEPS